MFRLKLDSDLKASDDTADQGPIGVTERSAWSALGALPKIEDARSTSATGLKLSLTILL